MDSLELRRGVRTATESATLPPGALRRVRMPSAVWQGRPLFETLWVVSHIPSSLRGVHGAPHGFQHGHGTTARPPLWPKGAPTLPTLASRRP
eukprot:9207575-Pyramimonas_sp.AAC.1